MTGFEERTAEWLAQQDAERTRNVATRAEEEERRQEELAALKGTTIENSKTRLLDILCNCTDEIQRGKVKSNEELGLVLEGIMAHAKGKGQQIDDDEPVEFTKLLEYQNSLLKTLKTREQVLMYSWWFYSKQCVTMDIDIDDDVIAAAKPLIALTTDRAEEEAPEEAFKAVLEGGMAKEGSKTEKAGLAG